MNVNINRALRVDFPSVNRHVEQSHDTDKLVSIPRGRNTYVSYKVFLEDIIDDT